MRRCNQECFAFFFQIIQKLSKQVLFNLLMTDESITTLIIWAQGLYCQIAQRKMCASYIVPNFIVL